MNIEKLMSKDLITLTMDDSLSKAKELFEINKIHHLLILDDDGLLAGVITDRDLYKHISPTIGTSQETHRDTSFMQKKVHQIMTRKTIIARPQQTVNKAVLQLYDNHITCLPIIDESNKPVGIITWRDILKVLAIQYRKKQSDNL